MLFDSLIALLAPFECLNCYTEGRLLCYACYSKLLPADKRCYKCHEPGRNCLTCRVCRQVSPLRSVQPATVYNGLAKALVLKLKFGRAKAAADEIATIMAARLGLDPDMSAYGDLLLTHVPTATSRVRQRGYDQAEQIARALAYRSAIPYCRLLLRSGQHKQLGADKQLRKRQLTRAFSPLSPGRTKGFRILLVDDVCTTGSTLEAAATALLRAGARQVDGIVFAKA